MERYEGPIVPGQADDPGDDQERPLPVCPVCGSLMRRRPEALKLSCDIHGMQTPTWTTAREEADA